MKDSISKRLENYGLSLQLRDITKYYVNCGFWVFLNSVWIKKFANTQKTPNPLNPEK
jgi:hypothetical protein